MPRQLIAKTCRERAHTLRGTDEEDEDGDEDAAVDRGIPESQDQAARNDLVRADDEVLP